MAIAEYTSKVYTFKTTPEQAKYLDSLKNKAEFIRRAIQDKIEREATIITELSNKTDK